LVSITIFPRLFSLRFLYRVLHLYSSNARKQEFSLTMSRGLSAFWIRIMCACLRQAWLSCSRLPARDTCGRWSSALTHIHTYGTDTRVVTVDQHSHAISGTWRRIEFVEITFSREPHSCNANCYPTGIRKPAMVNSSFLSNTRKRILIYHGRSAYFLSDLSTNRCD